MLNTYYNSHNAINNFKSKILDTPTNKLIK